jgi:hypothetical protein
MLAAAGALMCALMATAGGALAAPASTTFHVVGAEIAATSTEGTFVGKALGNLGDRAAWKAVVDHTRLGAAPATITGGTLRMTTLSPSLSADFVVGTFTGGSISVVNPGLSCSNQTFDVAGRLGNVTTSTTTGGSGRFDVVLTHYRILLFGHCYTYSATVKGTARFVY